MKIHFSVILVVVANTIPLLGVFWLDWEVLTVMVLFWMENIIIGLYNIPRILLASGGSADGMNKRLGTVVFFTIHYGLFTLAHGVFVFGMFGKGFLQGRELSVELLSHFILEYQLYWAIAALIISHGVSFILNYLLNDEYRTVTSRQMMKKPYDRVVVLHVGILAGGYVLHILNEPLSGLIVLIMIKTVFDVRGHRKEHQGYRLIENSEGSQYAGSS